MPKFKTKAVTMESTRTMFKEELATEQLVIEIYSRNW